VDEWTKGFVNCLFFTAAVAVLVLASIAVVVDERNTALEQLKRSSVRLEEARKLCKRQPHLSCAPIGGDSKLVACSEPGSTFFWLAVESAAAEDKL